MNSIQLSHRLALAKRISVQAGALLLSEMDRLKPQDVHLKSRNNFVTRVDLAVVSDDASDDAQDAVRRMMGGA